MSIGDAVASLLRDGMPVRFTAYDGSAAGPADAEVGLELVNQRGLSYLLTAPGDLGMARAYVAGDLKLHGTHPGDPYDALKLLQNHLRFRKPTPADNVTVQYKGTLVDGTEFDSSYKRGQPATFPVNGVIAGWTEALQLMKEGAKYQLFIPPNLAYADRGPLANRLLTLSSASGLGIEGRQEHVE